MLENFSEKEYSRHLLRDAIHTVCLSAQSVSPDKEFIAVFAGKYIKWRDIFKHVADKRVCRYGIIKPLSIPHQILLIKAYLCWRTVSVELCHRLREFMSRMRSGDVMNH